MNVEESLVENGGDGQGYQRRIVAEHGSLYQNKLHINIIPSGSALQFWVKCLGFAFVSFRIKS